MHLDERVLFSYIVIDSTISSLDCLEHCIYLLSFHIMTVSIFNSTVPTLTSSNKNHFTESLSFIFWCTIVNIHPRIVTHVSLYISPYYL